MIEFVVEGQPIAQPRLAQVWTNGTRRAYVPKRKNGSNHPVSDYKTLIWLRYTLAFPGREPLSGPLRLSILCVMKRPASLGKGGRCWHDVKPDADNLAKSVKDSLKGSAWKDDCQVALMSVQKVYAAHGEEPHTRIRISELTQAEVPRWWGDSLPNPLDRGGDEDKIIPVVHDPRD